MAQYMNDLQCTRCGQYHTNENSHLCTPCQNFRREKLRLEMRKDKEDLGRILRPEKEVEIEYLDSRSHLRLRLALLGGILACLCIIATCQLLQLARIHAAFNNLEAERKEMFKGILK